VTPALLVSLHDVSPLTLSDCEQAMALLAEAGVAPAQLTAFVIPHHEGQVSIDADGRTVAFVRALANGGATLAMHGLTHRMNGRARTPGGFFRAHIFARGQGELFMSDAADTARRLEQGAELLRRAGLEGVARAFVPPAWLLSQAAREVVSRAGFEFYEVFAGIVHGGRLRARRVIGWGSLSALEAVATALYARIQCRLPLADTRLAIHPADMRRAGQRRAVRRALERLVPRMRAQSYATYLAS
jgi:predicted deacetylase